MGRHNKPKGVYYLSHQCSDAEAGIILDVSVTGGDVPDSEYCVEQYKYLKHEKYPIPNAGLDSGYDTIEIHYGLTKLGITAFIHPSRKGTGKGTQWISTSKFAWDAENDRYVCPAGKYLPHRWTVRPTATQPAYIYAANNKDCANCEFCHRCFSPKKQHREIQRKVFLAYVETCKPSYASLFLLVGMAAEWIGVLSI